MTGDFKLSSVIKFHHHIIMLFYQKIYGETNIGDCLHFTRLDGPVKKVGDTLHVRDFYRIPNVK